MTSSWSHPAVEALTLNILGAMAEYGGNLTRWFGERSGRMMNRFPLKCESLGKLAGGFLPAGAKRLKTSRARDFNFFADEQSWRRATKP